MAVFVGVPMWPFRSFIMCHMFADTDEELEEMAQKLGLLPAWRQAPRASIGPHYDISKSKRNQAITFGAIPCDTLEEEIDAFERVEEFRMGEKNKSKGNMKKPAQKSLKEKRAEKKAKKNG